MRSDKVDVAAVSSIPAVRSAFGSLGVPTERTGAMAAVAGADDKLYRVYKHACIVPVTEE